MREDFVDEIIDDVAVATREGADESRRVIVPVERERSELQTSDPALGASLKGSDPLGLQLEAHRACEKLSSFGFGESQVLGAEFQHLSSRPESRQR